MHGKIFGKSPVILIWRLTRPPINTRRGFNRQCRTREMIEIRIIFCHRSLCHPPPQLSFVFSTNFFLDIFCISTFVSSTIFRFLKITAWGVINARVFRQRIHYLVCKFHTNINGNGLSSRVRGAKKVTCKSSQRDSLFIPWRNFAFSHFCSEAHLPGLRQTN